LSGNIALAPVILLASSRLKSWVDAGTTLAEWGLPEKYSL
jgi:hypothetical protein